MSKFKLRISLRLFTALILWLVSSANPVEILGTKQLRNLINTEKFERQQALFVKFYSPNCSHC